MTRTRFPDEATEDARLAGIRSRVLAATATEPTPRFSRAGKSLSAAIAAGGLAVALTGGAVAVIQATQEQIRTSVRCYAAPDLDARFTTAAIPTDAADAVDPVGLCGDMWRAGIIGQPVIPADPNTADYPVPDLVACTLQDGTGSGFPREGAASAQAFCRELGLAVWSR